MSNSTIFMTYDAIKPISFFSDASNQCTFHRARITDFGYNVDKTCVVPRQDTIACHE